MKKIVTIGSATQDIFVIQNDPHMIRASNNGVERSYLVFQDGEKIDIKNMTYHTGGGATNSAVSFARLGCTVSCCIRIGDDQQGIVVKKELEQQGITVHATIDPDHATGTSIILPTASKDRVVLVWRGANAFFEYADIPEFLFKDMHGMYISSLTDHSAHMFPALVQSAKKKSLMVATNPSTSQLKVGASLLIQSLAFIDIVICNASEAQLCIQALAAAKHTELTDLSFGKQVHHDWPELLQPSYGYNVRFFCKLALEYGPSVIVITNGKEGVYVATRDGLLFHPSLPTNIVTTLGAGDAFGSAFVASLMHGKEIKTATLEALLQARSVIEHADAKAGLLTKEQLAHTYHTLMQQYNDQFMLFDF